MEFAGTFPNPSFSKPSEQLGFELTATLVERRSLQCVVRGPFGDGGKALKVFEFNCKIFSMQLAVRAKHR